MPRLTTKQDLRAHYQLRRFWLNDQGLFADLTPTEQWQLHDFFQPDMDWSNGQLLEHRNVITDARPNLPHQAGRALAKFYERAAQIALLRGPPSQRPRNWRSASAR